MSSADVQKAFARDIRTQGGDVYSDDPRMQVYRDLFFNNVRGFIDNTFPVCAEVVGESYWTSLCERFFREHACRTPYFLKICEEFITWLSADTSHWSPHYPFLAELAHYEWLELAVDVLEAGDVVIDETADVENDFPVINPAHILAGYQYPVHTISADSLPEVEAPTVMVVYRDADLNVRFLTLNGLALSLLMKLQQEQVRGRDAVTDVLTQAGIPVSEVALNGGTEILRDWLQKGIVVGAVKSS